MPNAGRCMAVSIVEQGGRIAVSSPYHPNFPARGRFLGGEWDAQRHVWLFDVGEDDRVRSLCREVYGTDGADQAAPIPCSDRPARNEFSEGAAVPHYFGHRQRLRERMIANGAEGLPDYELLEEFIIRQAFGSIGDHPFAKALPVAEIMRHRGSLGELISGRSIGTRDRSRLVGAIGAIDLAT